jgi:hypothetical protein
VSVVKPIVHLNGTSVDLLIEQVLDAAAQVRAAMSALDMAAPNARDYYPVPGAFEEAQKQHLERTRKLNSVLEELIEIYHHLLEASEANQ